VTVSIFPNVLATAATGVTVMLEKPYCLMRLVGDTARAFTTSARTASLSFTAEQTLI